MNLSDIQYQISERASAFLNRRTHDLFIDGQWVAAQSGERLSTVNPATEAVIAEVATTIAAAQSPPSCVTIAAASRPRARVTALLPYGCGR